MYVCHTAASDSAVCSVTGVCRTDMSHLTPPEPLFGVCGIFKHTSMVIVTDTGITYVIYMQSNKIHQVILMSKFIHHVC